MSKPPLPRPRSERPGDRIVDLEQQVRRLEQQSVEYQGALGVARHLAQMMLEHPTASVRVYGESLVQALDDPDAWQAAIAADAIHPLGLAVERTAPPTAPRQRTDSLSGVISAYVASWSDALGADSARVIGPFVNRIAEARDSQELEMERSWLCADWVIREYTAFWLCQVDKHTDAARLLAMAPVRSISDLELRAEPVLSAIADQVEAELAELAETASADPGFTAALVNASLVANAASAPPVLSAIADQVEAELAELAETASADPGFTAALVNASLVAIATGGADAAFAASTVEPAAAVRMVDATQSLWVARAASVPDSADLVVADLCQEVIGLQASSVRLLEQLVEARTADDSPWSAR